MTTMQEREILNQVGWGGGEIMMMITLFIFY